MKDVPMDDFIIRALIAGLILAAVVGPLGCFVVWRRMAYFGDSLSHSALLGIALGILTGMGATAGSFIVCFGFAALLLWLQRFRILATDTLLGILAHSALSTGIVAISFIHHARVDIYAYLFGDILTINTTDLYWMGGGALIIVAVLVRHWTPLLLMTIHEDLAKAEGVRTTKEHFILVCLMTVMVAVSIRMVGIMLITSLLIIPAASARHVSHSPESMAVHAALFGALSVIIGITSSVHWNTPTGPTIVCCNAVIFMCIFVIAACKKHR
jgi:zinc transport system permease protein